MKLCRLRLVAFVLAMAAAPAAAAEPNAAVANTIPPDALGFVHIHVAELWASEPASQLRQFTAQAGPDLIAAVEKRFVPSPADIESLTVVIARAEFEDLLPAGRPTDVGPLWVIAAKKPYDRAALLAVMAKDAKIHKHGAETFYFDDSNWSGLYLIDDRTFAYGSEGAITNMLDRKAAASGPSPMKDLFAANAGKHPLTFGFNVQMLVKPGLLSLIPENLHPLTKARTWAGALDVAGGTRITLTAEFATEAEAAEGRKAAQAAIALGRQYIAAAIKFLEAKARGDGERTSLAKFPETAGLVLATAGMRQVDALMARMDVAQKGAAIQASQSLDGILAGGSTALGASGVALAIGYAMSQALDRDGVRISSPREMRPKNIRLVAEAIERYREDKGFYPRPYIADAEGRPLLSWRVELLPYLGDMRIAIPYYLSRSGDLQFLTAKELHAKFKLDEPWYGPNNKKLIEIIPDVFRSPYDVIPPYGSYGKTTLTAVVGKGAIFDPIRRVTLADVTDGTANTLLLFMHDEAAKARHWTNPEDVMLTADGKWPAGGPRLTGRFDVGFAFGGSRMFEKGMSEKAMLALVSRAGEEPIDSKEYLPLKKDPTPPAPAAEKK